MSGLALYYFIGCFFYLIMMGKLQDERIDNETFWKNHQLGKTAHLGPEHKGYHWIYE